MRNRIALIALAWVLCSCGTPDADKLASPPSPEPMRRVKTSAPITVMPTVTLLADGTHRVQIGMTPRQALKRLVVRLRPHDTWLAMAEDPGEVSFDDCPAGVTKTVTARVHLDPGRTFAYVTVALEVTTERATTREITSVLIGERPPADTSPPPPEGSPAKMIAPGEMPAPVSTPSGGREIQLPATPAK